MSEYIGTGMAALAVGLFGLATLSEATTTTTIESTTVANSTNDTVVGVPIPFYQLDDQIKPVLTIAAMAVFIIIGFIIAKVVDQWHDRKEPSENASDCSITTRQLLKQRVALQVFQDMSEKQREEMEAQNNGTEDDMISEAITGHKASGEGAEGGKELVKGEAQAEKAGKFWMFKTAFMGKKRERDPEAPAAEAVKPKEEAKIFTLPNTGKDGKGDQNTSPKNKEFIDVQFTHHRVEESFTISKRMSNDEKDTKDGENPFMYKYRHVSEDVHIPVRMMSPEAAAAKKAKNMEELGYYAELALAPTRLGHYADSDFGSNASLEQNKTNNNHDSFPGERAEHGEITRRKSPSPTKVHFSPSSGDSVSKPNTNESFYDDDFESISTQDNIGSRKRIRTGKTDKTEYSYASGPTIGTSLPSVGTVNTKTSEDDDAAVVSARRQVNENAAATAAGSKSPERKVVEKVEKPQQFSKNSTKDKGGAKKIKVQPRI